MPLDRDHDAAACVATIEAHRLWVNRLSDSIAVFTTDTGLNNEGRGETVIAAVRDWCLKNAVTWPEATNG